MNNLIKLKVIREDISFRVCSVCSGTGKKKRQFKGYKFIDNCSHCKGTGKEQFIKRTEILLSEALKILKVN